MPIVSRKRKEKAKGGDQYARFVEGAESIRPYDESVLDEALKKISERKPKGKKHNEKGNGNTPN